MTTRFDTKDPGEEVTAVFDYSKIGEPSLPAVSIAVRLGTDPAAAAMLQGAPSIVGQEVRQRIVGGVHGAEYALRCIATVGGDRLLIDAILPVRTRPNPA